MRYFFANRKSIEKQKLDPFFFMTDREINHAKDVSQERAKERKKNSQLAIEREKRKQENVTGLSENQRALCEACNGCPVCQTSFRTVSQSL